MAFTDSLANRHALGAIGQSVAGILDIHARVHFAALRQERRADTEFRIGSMGIPLRCFGGGDQFAELVREVDFIGTR